MAELGSFSCISIHDQTVEWRCYQNQILHAAITAEVFAKIKSVAYNMQIYIKMSEKYNFIISS